MQLQRGCVCEQKKLKPSFYLINPLLNTALYVRSSGLHWAGRAYSSLSLSHPGLIFHIEQAGGHDGDLNSWWQSLTVEGR